MCLQCLPSDIMTLVWLKSPYSYAALSGTCTHWNAFLKENGDTLFWKPIYDEMIPKNFQPGIKAPLQLQAVIKAFFLQNREDMDFLVNQIQNDRELARLLQSDACGLKEFREKHPLERFRLLWRALLIDATPVLQKLIKTYYSAYGTPTPPPQEVLKAETSKTLILSLTDHHKVPYDKVMFIFALMPGLHLSEFARACAIKIIKSHEDLGRLKLVRYLNSQSPVSDSLVAILMTNGAHRTQLKLKDFDHCNLRNKE